MGNNVSNLPDYLDINTFKEFAGDDRFNRDYFYAYKDPNTGKLSKEKVLEYALLKDIYVSYSWG